MPLRIPALVLALAACGPAAPLFDAGLPPLPDAGPPNDAGAPYPAFHPSVPQVKSLGGPVLAHPRIVAFVFDADPLAQELAAFVDELTAHPDYWSQATAEYGVGPLASTKTVMAHEPPPQAATNDDVQAWLNSHMDAFDNDTMYTVFYPASTNVVLTGAGAQCEAFGGYHLDAARPDGGTLFYVAMPRCPDLQGLTSLDLATIGASHEWAEGAADPHPTSEPAFEAVDDEHMAWAVSFSDYPVAEIGDMCALVPSDAVTPLGFTHKVQRIWSNAAARAGGDPCVPVAAGAVAFATEPVFPDEVTVRPPFLPAVKSRGVHVPVGATRTIELQLYSGAPTPAWSVVAYDVRALGGEPKRLNLSTNMQQGKNGDVLELTLEAVGSGPLGGAPFAVYSFAADGGSRVTFGFVEN